MFGIAIILQKVFFNQTYWKKHVPHMLDISSLKTVLVPGDVKFCRMILFLLISCLWDGAD
jgi:hypothetical protein